ncbi:MAG: tetratricopeptide repeat protein [Chitinophagaceae bacterium]|nr:tetratricopeptide repeat protein [Chitinophagaceae bacterium]MBP6432973.1 tetratricopeptide repeat protein [Ferruginibacter sp.]
MKQLLFFAFLFFGFSGYAQPDTVVTNLQKKLAATTNVSAKLDIILEIAGKYNLKNPTACEEILNKGIYIAEESRDRAMMIKARRIAGNIYSQMAGLKEYAAKALSYTTQALELCKQVNGIEKEKVSCNIQMARLQRTIENNTEAKKYNEAAIALAEDANDDSLIVITKLSYGRTQLSADEKLDAFKTFISAQSIAEKSKHPNKDWLEISAYNSLASFYSSIEDYDKSIDYQYKSLSYAKKNNNTTDIFSTLYAIGNNYAAAKKYDAAKNVFLEMIQLADSLKKPDNKIQGQIGMVNTLISGPEANKSLQYLKENPQIKELFNQINLGYQLDFGMGQIFSITRQYDSAKIYFTKSLPQFEKFASTSNLPTIYYQYSKFLYESGDYKSAISFLKKATVINDSLKTTNGSKECYQLLDSCYQKTGDYKNAFFYNDLFQKAKIESDEKSKAKDILSLEIDAENKRKERLQKEEEEKTRMRHNWQYMGIVMGIISLFILLATLGIFNVPLKWVRALGFISFIFLFEFIILLADTWIHHATHGEPWKVLAIKVVLIGMLLPLHHFLEHKAIQYITQRRNKKLVHQNLVDTQKG